MMRALTLAVLTLPILGLGGGIVSSEVVLRDATRWRIPITGYDPSDPLRGRYIRFQYVWQVAGSRRGCDRDDCRLCLQAGGGAVRIDPVGAVCTAAIDPRASGLSINYDSTNGQVRAGTRLWVSEAGAPALEAQLRGRPMVAVAKLTRGGQLIAERLAPAR